MEHNISTLDEAKVYFKTLWQPMESECVLHNLQKILNFLQSPADEVCFVNMQEKYLPFYYMIIVDEEFLQTTFLTDECKVVANGILKTLEVNKNSFTWEVSFSTQIAGIPVIFRKVYTQLSPHLKEDTDTLIQLEFKEKWVKTTLNFIKSSSRIFKYPEMNRRETLYLYNGILKLKEDGSEQDSLWAPVWEALNIFKLRYEFIVSIYPTTFDYLKFVQFEKVIIRRRSCAVEIANSVALLDYNINESKLLTNGETDVVKNKVDGIHGKPKDLLVPVVDHKELVKTLLKMNVTKSGTIVYTLKIDDFNGTSESKNELQEMVHQSSDDIDIDNNAIHTTSLSENQVEESKIAQRDADVASLSDELTNVNLTLVVQREVKTADIQHSAIIKTVNENELVTQETISPTDNPNDQNETLCNDDINTPNFECNDNKDSDETVSDEKSTETEIEINNIENENVTKGFEHTDTSLPEIEVIEPNSDKQLPSDIAIVIDADSTDVSDVVQLEYNAKCDNTQTQELDSDDDVEIISNDDTPIEIDDSSDETDEPYPVNAFLQQITKIQKNNSPSFMTEEDFISIDDKDEPNCIINDLVLKKKLKSVYSETSDVYRHINEQSNVKNPSKNALKQMKREQKLQRRHENKIRKNRNLVDNVSTKFILTSFKAILDFINDEARATMEMVGLTIHEFNVLIKLHGFSPSKYPIEKMFHQSCLDLVRQLFHRLNKIDSFLEITWDKSNTKGQKPKTDTDGRGRCLMFVKRPFKKPRAVNPGKGLLETPSIPPLRPRVSPARRRKSWGRNISRSPSVSPARPSGTPSSRGSSISPRRQSASPATSNVKLEEENSDKTTSSRSQNASSGKVAVAMKAKMLEGLAVPLESNKAMRMMRLMGWNGGALGVRGTGLIEPIQPQLDVPKGFGLGHKRFKSTQRSLDKLQRKVMHDKYLLEKSAEAAIANNVKDISDVHVEDYHSNIDIDNNNKREKESDELVRNNAVENQVRSSWLTNEKLLQKIKDKISTRDRSQEKIETSAVEKTKDKSLDKEESLETSSDEVRTNFTELLISLRVMHERGHGEFRVHTDEKLHPYTREKKTKHLTNRMQFLVHLLELLQSDKESTVVSFLKKPTSTCIGFMDSIVWSLNRRVKHVPEPMLREQTIVDACAREMAAHPNLILTYDYRKKLLTLQKTDAYANPYVADTPTDFEVTHYVNDFRLYREMPQGPKGAMRTKIFTNRIILDFVKSGDEERIYFYGNSSLEIRGYIVSLISLLNRQMAMYQLGLGNSEHPVFRETLHRMQNFCLLYRFDTPDLCFTKLQLVKVDFEKRCRICQLPKDSINVTHETAIPLDNDDENLDDSYDVDIYPNRFDVSKDDVTKSDSDSVIEKNTNSQEGTCDTDDTRQTEPCEEYLVGEDWLNSDEKNDTNTEEFVGSNTDVYEERNNNEIEIFSQESSNIEDTVQKNNENASLEEMSSDFHNWPKRIKRNVTDHNVHDENIKWNTPENYETNVQDPKRKINKQKTDDVIELYASDSLERFDDAINAVDINNSNKENINLNTGTQTNVIDDIDKEPAETNNFSEITNNEKNVTEDKLEIIKEANEKIQDLDTLPDDGHWPKNLLIVHCNPKKEIYRDGAVELQSIIYEAVTKFRYLPRLKCCGLKNGGIVYTCFDFESYIWLYDHLRLYKIVLFEHVLHSRHVIELKVNTFIKIDVDDILNNIEKFYGNIKTDMWKVLKTRDFVDNCVITIEVVEILYARLWREYRVHIYMTVTPQQNCTYLYSTIKID